MTWPLTFSSPPSVEFHLRGTALGTLKAGARAKEVARGSYHQNVSMNFSLAYNIIFISFFFFLFLSFSFLSCLSNLLLRFSFKSKNLPRGKDETRAWRIKD